MELESECHATFERPRDVLNITLSLGWKGGGQLPSHLFQRRCDCSRTPCERCATNAPILAGDTDNRGPKVFSITWLRAPAPRNRADDEFLLERCDDRDLRGSEANP